MSSGSQEMKTNEQKQKMMHESDDYGKLDPLQDY